MSECLTVSLLIAIAFLMVLFYWLLEIHYFLRMLFSYLHSRFVKKKLDVLDTASYSSLCLTTDVDILLFHMNNARFLRELDFARSDFYSRTNLWHRVREMGGEVYQGGTCIRYRRFIKLFSLYHITSRIVYWDQTCIYMEHRFITKGDNFVRAIAYGRQKVVKINVEELMVELMKNPFNKKAGEVRPKPECPLEIKLWIDSMDASSTKLRENVV